MHLENSNGYRVEQVTVTTVDRCRTYLRVTCHGVFIADCPRIEDVARHVDLSTLTEQAPAN